MKKLTVLAMFLVIVLTLSACSKSGGKSFDDLTAYEHYVAVNKKTEAAKSIEMTLDAVIGMSMPSLGMNMDMNMSGDVQQVIRSKTDQDMRMDLTFDMMGESMAMQMYYVDGMMYQDDGTSKTKYPISLGELSGEAGMANGMQAMEFTEADILDSKMEDAEGGKKIIFVLDPKKVSALAEQFTGPALASLGDEDIDMSFDISRLDYEMTFDREHNLKNMRVVMTMNMVMAAEGVEIDMDMDMDMFYKVVAVNSVSKIALPADADAYILTPR